MKKIPQYTVRYSKRAKYVRLSISPEKGLEIILPIKSSADCIPALLKDKQHWINKHVDKLTPKIKPNLPESIYLQAMGLKLNVRYIALNYKTVKATLIKDSLNVVGNVKNETLVKEALLLEIKTIAKKHFLSQAQQLAKKYNFSYQQIKIRAQKTRWGSCSTKGNINLNYKLIFMPPSYLHYVLLHEFTHTKIMNHSVKFWKTLEQVLPNSKFHDQQMKSAHKYIPQWSDYEFT